MHETLKFILKYQVNIYTLYLKPKTTADMSWVMEPYCIHQHLITRLYVTDQIDQYVT